MNRSRLTAEVIKLIFEKYPVAWSAQELSIATSGSRRSVERVIADLLVCGIIEKRYSAYRLHSNLINQFYGAQWYLRQETERDLSLRRQTNGKK